MLLVVHVEGKRDDRTFSLGDEGVVFIGWLHEYEFHDFFFLTLAPAGGFLQQKSLIEELKAMRNKCSC